MDFQTYFQSTHLAHLTKGATLMSDMATLFLPNEICKFPCAEVLEKENRELEAGSLLESFGSRLDC